MATTYALRQRLNLAAAILLFMMVAAGCLALELARQQHADAVRLLRWQDQQRLAEAARQAAEQLVAERLHGLPVESQRIALFDATIHRLLQQLGAFQADGTMALGTAYVSLDEILHRLQQYEAHASELARTPQPVTRAEWLTLLHEGTQLETFFDAVTAALESRSLANVARISSLQVAGMAVGLVTFLLGVWLLHGSITRPLQRMVQGIEAMRRTGRLVKLPAVARNELGLVAEEFNRLSDHVEEQKRRLREHVVELQRVNIELDHLANLKDDFLATVNHQLRTPLTAIVEGLSLMRDQLVQPDGAEQQLLLDTMEANARKLTQLVQEMLDLTLLRSGRRVLSRRPDDLTPLLQRAVAAWQAHASTRTVRLSCSTLPAVYMDPEAISEVVDQLMRNALRHTPQRSEITIDARVVERMVEVAVKNPGEGLSPEQVRRLFQPFVHLHTPEAPGSEGSGMGLALCRQIIERHRGAIRAESAPGRGTTITFALPIASRTFLFDDACRSAQEDAEYETQQFGVVLVSSPRRALEAIESLLRRHTHRGDRFVRLDDPLLAIVAVTDQAGLAAMTQRLRGVLAEADASIQLGTALSPLDGASPEQLLQVARDRLALPVASAGFLPQSV